MFKIENKNNEKFKFDAKFIWLLTSLNMLFATGVLALPAGINSRILELDYGKDPKVQISESEKSIGQELTEALKKAGIEVVTMNNPDPEKGYREWFRDFGLVSGEKFYATDSSKIDKYFIEESAIFASDRLGLVQENQGMSDLSILENSNSFKNIRKSGYEIILSDRYFIQGGDILVLKTKNGLSGVLGINTLFANLYLAGQLDTISDSDIENMVPTLLESKLALSAVRKMEKRVYQMGVNSFNEPKSKTNLKFNNGNVIEKNTLANGLVSVEVRPRLKKYQLNKENYKIENWKLLLGGNPDNLNLSELEKSQKLAKRMAYLRVSMAKFLSLESVNWMNNQRFHIDLDNSVFYKLTEQEDGKLELNTVFGVGDAKMTSNALLKTLQIYNSKNDEENAKKIRALINLNLYESDINKSGVDVSLYLDEIQKVGIEINRMPSKFSDTIDNKEANLANLIPIVFTTENGISTGVITSSTGNEELNKVISEENQKLGIQVSFFVKTNYLVTKNGGSIRCLTLVDTLQDALKLVEQENQKRGVNK